MIVILLGEARITLQAEESGAQTKPAQTKNQNTFAITSGDTQLNITGEFSIDDLDQTATKGVRPDGAGALKARDQNEFSIFTGKSRVSAPNIRIGKVKQTGDHYSGSYSKSHE